MYLDTDLLREDTHKKSFFFSGRTTKIVGRGNPPTTKQKHLFSINGENSPGSCIMKILFYEVRNFSPNFEFTSSLVRRKKEFVKIRFRYKTKKKKKKWHGPLSHWCREGKPLVVRPLKNVCLPLIVFIKMIILTTSAQH